MCPGAGSVTTRILFGNVVTWGSTDFGSAISGPSTDIDGEGNGWVDFERHELINGLERAVAGEGKGTMGRRRDGPAKAFRRGKAGARSRADIVEGFLGIGLSLLNSRGWSLATTMTAWNV